MTHLVLFTLCPFSRKFLPSGSARDAPSVRLAEDPGKMPPQGEYVRWREVFAGSSRARKSLSRIFPPAGLTIRPVSAWANGRFRNRHLGETERGGGVRVGGGFGGDGGGSGERRFSNGPPIGGRGVAAGEEAGEGKRERGWAGVEEETEWGERWGKEGSKGWRISGGGGGASPGGVDGLRVGVGSGVTRRRKRERRRRRRMKRRRKQRRRGGWLYSIYCAQAYQRRRLKKNTPYNIH